MFNYKNFSFFTLCKWLSILVLNNCAYADEFERIQFENQEFACATPLVRSVDDVKKYGIQGFDLNVVAGTYAIYAASSFDAYTFKDNKDISDYKAFHIADNYFETTNGKYGKTGWTRDLNSRHENLSGLAYEIYYHDKDDRLDVMVAYRGTDGFFDMDLLANLSWITQWINPWDQYRQARNEFKSIMLQAIQKSNGRPISFITTGHSLGGGLAQHVANVHPCTSSVVFNSSFVTNSFFFKKYNPVIVKIYEEGDLFEFFSKRVINSSQYSIYRFPITLGNKIIANHNMEKIAAGMSRWTIDSCRNAQCQVDTEEQKTSEVLFCERYIKFHYDSNNREVLRMKEPDVCPSHSEMH